MIPRVLRARLFAGDDCLHYVRCQAATFETSANLAAQLILNPRRGGDLGVALGGLERAAKVYESEGTRLLKSCVITACDSDDLRTLLSRLRWCIESLNRVSGCAELHPPESVKDAAARILDGYAAGARQIVRAVDQTFAVPTVESFSEEFRRRDALHRRLLRESHGLLAQADLSHPLRMREKELLRRLAIFRGCANHLAESIETLHFKNH